jgi:GT2 family glycosyltransferase
MKNPLVSIIILNWNGKRWLEKCLPTLQKIKYKPLEIIVVNNGSTDDSADFLKKKFSDVKVIEIKKNVGYAGANNIGVKKAKGKYVLLMNNDTTATSTFVESLVSVMENDETIGIVQPQIRSMINPKLLDSVGSFFTFTGFLYHYGYMKPHKQKKYDHKLFAYSIKGACFLMKRDDYIKLGGFDEDFVCYVEETDLCHRVWLSGKKVLYLPSSIIYHWGGGDMQVMTRSELTVFRSFRNRYLSYLKNFSIPTLILLLPVHIVYCELFVVGAFFSGQFKKAIAAQLGVLAPFITLDATLKKRKKIQLSIRKVTDWDILKYVYRNPRISYYYYLFSDIGRYKD